jgi:hypothetical protein
MHAVGLVYDSWILAQEEHRGQVMACIEMMNPFAGIKSFMAVALPENELRASSRFAVA